MTLVWNAESVRLTLFTLGNAPSGGDLLSRAWTQLTGTPPEQAVSRPGAGVHQAEGPFGGGRLVLLSSPARVDMLFAGEPATPFEPAVIGSPAEAIDTLLSAVSAKVENVIAELEIQRVALGATLLQPVASRADGYRALAGLLPALKLDAEGASDFSYQINRPRPSRAVEGLTVNRLSKWSVQATMLSSLTMLLTESAGIAPLPAAVRFAARVELDVNTGAERREALPSARVLDLLSELRSLTLELAASGDVP